MTAENTPPEAPDNAVSDFLYSGAPGEGSSPENARERLYAEAHPLVYQAEHLRAEVEQLKDEVVRTNDRFAKARVRNGQLRARAEAAERARDDALARESRLREAMEGLLDSWTEGIEVDLTMGSAKAEVEPLERLICHLRALLAVQEPPAATEDTPTERGRA